MSGLQCYAMAQSGQNCDWLLLTSKNLKPQHVLESRTLYRIGVKNFIPHAQHFGQVNQQED